MAVDTCKSNKIDSNITGLRYAEEECLAELAYVSRAVPAVGDVTLGSNPADGDTVTIGDVDYTFETALSTGPTVANQILIGASAAETAVHLNAAINNLAGVGVTYSIGTVINPDVKSTVDATNPAKLLVEAKVAGDEGNTLELAETGASVTVSGATFEDGADEEAVVPVFYPLEPNSYNDFGGQITTVARNPINPSRQRKKGVTTDLDASGGFEQDLTFSNTTRLLQGFFFADAREPFASAKLNGNPIPITSIAANAINADDDLDGFRAGDLVVMDGFEAAANSGLKRLSAATATALTTVEGLTVEATPPATANVRAVGFQFASGDATLTKNGELVRLNSTAKDLLEFGLVPGAWVYLGGATATFAFGTNKGFARCSSIDSDMIEFDKVAWEDSTEDAGTGKTIQIFFGTVIRNEPLPENIKRRTYHIERTLGRDDDGEMSEYLVGAVPNELTLNIPQAEKATVSMSFVAVDNEQRTGLQGKKVGTRPELDPENAFNTSSDINRIRLSIVNEADANPQELFAFATDLSLSINNNVTPVKAIGVLGAFDTSAGTFEVSGNLTAYFASVEALQAVRNNSDVTLDIIMVKDGKALLFDIPLLSLGDGRLNVSQDEAITLPLETNAAQSKFNHTFLFQSFGYLPAGV